MKIFLAFAASLFLVCCNNSSDTKNEPSDKESSVQPGDASGSNVIEFKVDGDLIKSEGWVVQRFIWDEKTKSPWLNIVSSMHKDKRTVNANLNGAVPGTYNFNDGKMFEVSGATYYPDYFQIMDAYTFKSGSFNITEVDTVKGILNGTFSGTVTNTEGKSLSITDGKIINAKLKAGVTNLSKGFNQ